MSGRRYDFLNTLKRFKRDPKIGLALSSGSARGEAHVGVIKAIIDRDIPIMAIAGASAGAIVGACFALNGNVDRLEDVIHKARPKEMIDMMSLDLALRFKGFIGHKKSLRWLKSVIGGVYFSDLKIPLSIVATDMTTGEEVAITKGSVLEAVRASIAMPVLFTPTKSQGRFLVDGGFANPLPVNTARSMGANFIIASNVVRTPQVAKAELAKEGRSHMGGVPEIILSEELERAKEGLVRGAGTATDKKLPAKAREIPNMFNVLVNSVYTMEYKFVRSSMRQADIAISPDISELNMLDFYQGALVIDKGYEMAARRLDKFARRLKGMQG